MNDVKTAALQVCEPAQGVQPAAVVTAEDRLIAQWVGVTNTYVAARGIPGEEYGTIG
jgi:hypothetical protein